MRNAEPAARPRLTRPQVLTVLATLFVGSLLLVSLASASSAGIGQYPPTATPTQTAPPTPSCVPTATPAPGGVPYLKRINAGGPAYTDSQGHLWEADRQYAPCSSPYGYTPSATSIYTTTASIAGTSDPTLYQSQRFAADFGYWFLVPNGSYRISLRFAELYYTGVFRRQFNVVVNGVTQVANLDVYLLAGGGNKAYDVVIDNMPVTNGLLQVDFATVFGGAVVNAIQVEQISPAQETTTPTATAPASPTASPTGTATGQPTATPSATPSVTPQGPATATRTATATATASVTASAVATTTATQTAMPTGTRTATVTATSQAAATGTATLPATPTATVAPSDTATVTVTATATQAATATASPSATPTSPSEERPYRIYLPYIIVKQSGLGSP